MLHIIKAFIIKSFLIPKKSLLLPLLVLFDVVTLIVTEILDLDMVVIVGVMLVNTWCFFSQNPSQNTYLVVKVPPGSALLALETLPVP